MLRSVFDVAANNLLVRGRISFFLPGVIVPVWVLKKKYLFAVAGFWETM